MYNWHEGAIVMTQQEWIDGYPERTNIIREGSPLDWPVGTKTTLFYDPKHGTCLAPVFIAESPMASGAKYKGG